MLVVGASDDGALVAGDRVEDDGIYALKRWWWWSK